MNLERISGVISHLIMRTCQHSERQVVEVMVVLEEVVVVKVVEEVGVAAAAVSDDNHLVFLNIFLMLKYTIFTPTSVFAS